MKLSTLKAILVTVVAMAAISVGIVFSINFEKSHEQTPEGAGSRQPVSTEMPVPSPMLADTPDPNATAPAETPQSEQRYGQGVDTVIYKGQEYVWNDALSTLLLIGIDDDEMTKVEGHRNDGLADFLVLAILNSDTKTCTLLQINRNTMADMWQIGALGEANGLINQQICYAHTYGSGMEDSCEYTVYAVSRLLYNTPIDNYLSLAMGGISILNDKVGGVPVTIEDDFSQVDPTLVQGETVTLMGEHAEKFVRARHSMTDDSNPARMRRQRAYMSGLVQKLKESVNGDTGFVVDLYTSIADYLVTDCDINELNDYSTSLAEYEIGEFATPEGETRLREQTDFAEFYADQDALRDLVIRLFYVPYNADGEPVEVTAEPVEVTAAP